MNFKRFLLLIALTLISAPTLSARDRMRRDPPRTPDNSAPPVESLNTPAFAEYEILLKRNIFSREQPRPKVEARPAAPIEEKTEAQVQEDKAAREREAAMKIDAEIVLTGLVIRDGVGFAVLDDRRAGKSLASKVGDTLGSGKVVGITLDALEYAGIDGKTAMILIGSNLLGKLPSSTPAISISTITTTPTPGTTVPGAAAAVPGSTATPGGAAGSGSTGGAGAADDPNLSVIERMRRRRQRELNR